MPELENVQPETDAGYVNMSSARAKRKAKLEADEAELKALMEGKDDGTEETREDEPEQETDQKGPDSTEDAEPENAEERTFKKRYGDLRRHSQAKERELLDRITALEEAKGDGVSAPPKSKEELQEWMKKYPEVASIVKSIANQEAQKLTSETSDKLRLLEEREYELQVRQAEGVIRKSHPDFDKLRGSDEFHDWAESQSKWVQDALYENETDPKAVVSVINLYKAEAGLTQPAKKMRQKEAATAVNSKSTTEPVNKDKPTFSESQVHKNSDAWFSKNYEAIQEAMREGRFDYDMSGGAR